MDEYESLSHSKWECKYHVVFIPKGRRRAPRECGRVRSRTIASVLRHRARSPDRFAP